MNSIGFYCQNLLGIGHISRSLAFCQSLLSSHEVHFIQGGPKTHKSLEGSRFTHTHIDPLLMNQNGELYSPSGKILKSVFEKRNAQMIEVSQTSYDLFIFEFFPFGRYKFREEILNLIKLLKKRNPQIRLIASMRDIHTLKPQPEKTKKRAEYCVSILNEHFDALFVHSDPDFISLEESFPSIAKIQIPINYTGYLSPKIEQSKKKRNDVIVSIGGGLVGEEVFKRVKALANHFPKTTFNFFKGPYSDFEIDLPLNCKAMGPSSQFALELNSSKLSISMAGYNTCVELLETKTPAILFPYDENNEQGLRCRKMAEIPGIIEYSENTFEDDVARLLNFGEIAPTVDLNGQRECLRLVKDLLQPE